MDADRWARVQAVCLAALEQPRADRPKFVSRACGTDEALLREVHSLLAEHDAEPDFLETPLVLPSASVEEAGAPTVESRYVGPYRLVRPLGHGGMGDVYLAVSEAEGLRRPVAVKVVRRGLDGDRVLRRFQLEQRILAGLDHPAIARLLDGGATDDGSPYFVMEYVEGLPVDEYCDTHGLPVARRLALFRAICDAVQHAHRNLIVHRDIKPANVLVMADGSPKLLDFGISKVLAPDRSLGTAIETRADARLLTPEYAAPEQLRAESVTTATDVYALGVLLYVLLAGRHPFATGAESPAALERAVCETDPERPSALVGRPARRARGDGEIRALAPEEVSARRGSRPGQLGRTLSGDLDNIVLMAMRRDPARRYASPAELGEDIRRHLAGLPVAARPDTLLYRTGKFVRRHALAVTTAATVVVALAVTTAVTATQSRRVAQERDRAVEVRGFLMEMFGAAGGDQVADTLSARQLLDLQAERVSDAYTDRPELRAEMMDVLADGYDRLGLAGEAEPWARAALELRRTRLRDDHPDIAASLNTVGWIIHERGRSNEAEPFLRESVRINRDAGPRFRVALSRSMNDLGVVLESQGDLEGAEALYRDALEVRLDELGPHHRSVGITANNLATTLFRQGRYDEAARAGAQSLRALQRSVGPDHQRSIIAQSNLALFQRRGGDLEGAEAVFRDLVQRQTRLQGEDHPITAWTMGHLAAVLLDAGKVDEAEAMQRAALAIQEAVLGPDHRDIASTLTGLGNALMARGAYGEAEQAYERALSIEIGQLGERHSSVGVVLASLARLWRVWGRPEAIEGFRRALGVWDESLGPSHPRTVTLRGELARMLMEDGDPALALVELEASHEAALAGSLGGQIHATRLDLAEAHLALGHRAVADSLVEVTGRALERGAGDPTVRERVDALRARIVGSG